MDFLFITAQELSALAGLPYIHQVTYLMCIKPYMDRKTFIVGGSKRRISYQSLSEALYVEPHQGITCSGSPSRQQVRRVIKSLEKAGLIAIQSAEKHLILKCLLAKWDNFVQNKPDTNPTQQTDTENHSENTASSRDYNKNLLKPDIDKTVKADTPHNSEKDLVCLGKIFETFWESYPQPADKQKSWQAFVQVNPDEVLFAQMMQALKQQISHYEKLKKQGQWVPNWKYPANWLTQQSWNQVITSTAIKESVHEKNQRSNPAKNTFDLFWASCEQGATLSFDDIPTVQ